VLPSAKTETAPTDIPSGASQISSPATKGGVVMVVPGWASWLDEIGSGVLDEEDDAEEETGA
jgi:hypothetical protein